MFSAAMSRASAVFGVGFSFVIMTISGLLLIIAPRGSTANRLDWHMLGLTRSGWEAVHLATSSAFILFGVWHTVLHWPIIKGFVLGTPMHPSGHRREGWAVFVIVLVLLLSAILNFPPASWLVELNEYFKKEYWLLAG